jgi:hypothetical protein
MKFGEYDGHALDLGDFMVDGGAFLGTIPKVQKQAVVVITDTSGSAVK